MIERSLVLLKPDAIVRGVTGEILHRFERAGLKIIGMKMAQPDVEFVKQHYLTTEDNLRVMGERTLKDCEESGDDPVEMVGTADPVEIGRLVWKWGVEFLMTGPVIALVFEGPNAISNIRSIVGNTMPVKAAPGTIRGDFGLDSAVVGNKLNRAIYNLVHASGNAEEAEREVKLWFSEKELFRYRRLHEDFYKY